MATRHQTPADKPKTSAVLATVALTKDQRSVLSEALRRSEETRDVVEDALLDFGRWLLVHVFSDDAKAALEERRRNGLWLELWARAGGPSLRLSRKFLYLAVTI